jgi:hypothetical protein
MYEYRRQLETAVVKKYGEISFCHSELINAAVRMETAARMVQEAIRPKRGSKERPDSKDLMAALKSHTYYTNERVRLVQQLGLMTASVPKPAESDIDDPFDVLAVPAEPKGNGRRGK